jgi:hypothetical protein
MLCNEIPETGEIPAQQFSRLMFFVRSSSQQNEDVPPVLL